VAEVDVDSLRLKDLETAAGIVVALLEGVKRVEGVAAKAKGRAEAGPVDLCGRVALEVMLDASAKSYWRKRRTVAAAMLYASGE
jgi:hypothetical protein